MVWHLLYVIAMEMSCPHCNTEHITSDKRKNIVRFGSFLRKHDKKLIHRFLCKICKRTFSPSTESPIFKQHKPDLNSKVTILLCSKVSQRRVAEILGINIKTVARKFLFMGMYAKLLLYHWNTQLPQSSTIEFDDLETFEHTKLKPISVTLAVEHKSRRILGHSTSRMPAKGRLTKLSIKKYGKRKDERTQGRKRLFESLRSIVVQNVKIKTDQNPHYVGDVKKFFPKSVHERYLGRRGCVIGYGELKRGGFDPLFSLNHTYAMLRDNINRLARKTWATTKKKEYLDLHIALYSLYHNLRLMNENM